MSLLAKLRATNNADIRRVLGMPSQEADRCVNADDPATACDAWLVNNAAETRDAEGASMNGSEDLQHSESAAENDTQRPGLRQPGCDVVRELYGELAGSMGFDAAVVSEKIKATFADFSKSQIRNAGKPAHYNRIKADLCQALLGVE